MSNKQFGSEFERAMARSDIDQLKRIIAEHFAEHKASKAGENTENYPLDPLIFERDDPERNLALVAIAMSTYDDESYLGLVSAGLLEDIFFLENKVPDQLLMRIEAEALRNPRFLWMLSGMYSDSFKPECREFVQHLTKDISFGDPMPPKDTQ